MTEEAFTITVTLTGPAKIGDRHCTTGDTIKVSPLEAVQLENAGLTALYPAEEVPLSEPRPEPDEAFVAAVAAQAKLIAEATVDAAVEYVVGTLVAEKEAALDRAKASEAARDIAETRVRELEAALATPGSKPAVERGKAATGPKKAARSTPPGT